MKMFNDRNSGLVKDFISNPTLIKETDNALDNITEQELKLLKKLKKRKENDKQRDNSESPVVRTQPECN